MLSSFGIGLSLVGSYVFTSILIFKFPHLVHKKNKKKFATKCVHISHRGGAGEYLENTMAAFQNAAQQGTDMFEIDLQLTKDEKVVISHDNNLLRTTGNNELISNLLYKDLPPLNSSLKLDFSHNTYCTNENDRQITLLEDLFNKFPTMPVNIDIKANNDILVRSVSELVVKYNRENITVWGNYQNVTTSKCYKQNPNIHLLFSMQKVFYLLTLFYTGLLPFIPIKESCLELFLPSVFYKSKKEILNSRQGIVFRAFLTITDVLLMNKALFNHLQKRGIQVYLWVLNDEEEFKRAVDLGVSGIMTDYPTKLKEFLSNNPQYFKSTPNSTQDNPKSKKQ